MCSRAGDRTAAPCGRGAGDGPGEGDEDCETGRPGTGGQAGEDERDGETAGRSGTARLSTASRDGGAGELDRLGKAIDEVADAARGRDASTQELAGRLARVWDMVAELDPELARRIADYRG
jgi:hypothetical protein